jgi:hypothetical protein
MPVGSGQNGRTAAFFSAAPTFAKKSFGPFRMNHLCRQSFSHTDCFESQPLKSGFDVSNVFPVLGSVYGRETPPPPPPRAIAAIAGISFWDPVVDREKKLSKMYKKHLESYINKFPSKLHVLKLLEKWFPNRFLY